VLYLLLGLKEGCVYIKKRNILVSLDIGTNSIKAAMAEVHGQDVHLLGVSQVPSFGLRKGSIIDIESTAKSIDNSLTELERLTGIEVYGALLGFSGVSISVVNNHAVVAVANPTYEITLEDKERVLTSARNLALPLDKAIIQIIERQYIVDSYDGVKDPVGMVGSRLEAEVSIVVGAIAAIQNLQRSAQRINLNVDDLMYNALLGAESVLSPAELEMGVTLVDIGGGTTEVTYFEEGSVVQTSVLPIGGDYITKDLAIVLRTSMEEANRVKERYGVASPDMAKSDLMVNVHNIQGKDGQQVSQQVIAEIISARVIEMTEMIYAELKQFGCLNRMPGGIVLTGGAAELVGLVDIMEEYTTVPVRLGLPENMKGLPTDFNRPQNAVVLGGILYSARQGAIKHEDSQRFMGMIDRITYWFKELFR
jgi:cell division protein FtsA